MILGKTENLGNSSEIDAQTFNEAKKSKTPSGGIENNKLIPAEGMESASKENGRIINEALNKGIVSFNPDLMFENIVNNYSMAKKIYGESLIRLISGYNSSYVEKNIKIPEFAKQLKQAIEKKVDELKQKKLVNKEHAISNKGEIQASIFLCSELDYMIPQGSFGEKIHKKLTHYGDIEDTKKYKSGDRYRDIDIKKSIKLAVRRGRVHIDSKDLKTSTRVNKGKVLIVYAIDASGSMKGKKLEYAKKAGVALSYKAIESKDQVGLLIFGDEIRKKIYPTNNFISLLKNITNIKARNQTDFKNMLESVIEMYPLGNFTKHLILLTDAMPTVGDDPEKSSLKEISKIRAAGITVSVVGINLKDPGVDFAKNIIEIGEGKLYLVSEVEKLDKIILEDYYDIK